jgi:hypothetical protein
MFIKTCDNPEWKQPKCPSTQKEENCGSHAIEYISAIKCTKY